MCREISRKNLSKTCSVRVKNWILNRKRTLLLASIVIGKDFTPSSFSGFQWKSFQQKFRKVLWNNQNLRKCLLAHVSLRWNSKDEGFLCCSNFLAPRYIDIFLNWIKELRKINWRLKSFKWAFPLERPSAYETFKIHVIACRFRIVSLENLENFWVFQLLGIIHG